MSRHDEMKKLWKNRPIEPDVCTCFCHEYRCPHRDYSLCPKDCEKPRTRKFCPQGDCPMALHLEECERQKRILQENREEKVKHIHDTTGVQKNIDGKPRK